MSSTTPPPLAPRPSEAQRTPHVTWVWRDASREGVVGRVALDHDADILVEKTRRA